MPLPKNQEHDNAPYSAEDLRNFAEQVRSACIDAALQGYEDARMSGLCHEGAWENAISAIQLVDLAKQASHVQLPKEEIHKRTER